MVATSISKNQKNNRKYAGKTKNNTYNTSKLNEIKLSKMANCFGDLIQYAFGI